MKTHVIAVTIQKGGTGKTTTTAAIAQAAVADKKKVLCIDLDPQCNLTYALNADANKTIADIIAGAKAADIIKRTPQGLDMIAGSNAIATLENSKGAAHILNDIIEPIKKYYDLILIDTPPTAGILQLNAMQAATGLLIPLNADIYNVQGLTQIINTAEIMKKSNSALQIMGVIFTKYDKRAKLTNAVKDEILKICEARNISFIGTVRQGVAIAEAQTFKKSLFDYAPKSNPATDYMNIYKALNI